MIPYHQAKKREPRRYVTACEHDSEKAQQFRGRSSSEFSNRFPLNRKIGVGIETSIRES